MPRPFCRRRVGWMPKMICFYPEIHTRSTRPPEKIVLTLDELEAIRLADLMGLYQEEAAKQMGISRPTFGRVIDSAHKKVAEFLIEGKMLCIEGGPVEMAVASQTGAETPFSPCEPSSPFPFYPPRCGRGGRIMSAKDQGHKSSFGPPAGIRRGSRGRHGLGLGPEGFCLCPKCGFRKPHQPGVPCIEERCSNCGSALVREGSEHHRQVEERGKKHKDKKGGE